MLKITTFSSTLCEYTFGQEHYPIILLSMVSWGFIWSYMVLAPSLLEKIYKFTIFIFLVLWYHFLQTLSSPVSLFVTDLGYPTPSPPSMMSYLNALYQVSYIKTYPDHFCLFSYFTLIKGFSVFMLGLLD